jgi:pantoate--beta-alanine ligase
MRIVRTPEELGGYHGGAFVPTMGALHDGHLLLVRRARQLGGPVVVSVFVNPTQFGRHDDLDRYPRDLAGDAIKAEAAGADLVFAPSVETMYPPDRAVPVPPLPAVAREPGLEDACRPGHFEGVCQVVARLFDLVRPRVAVFGEKDYQQLLVIEALVEQERDRWAELRIEPLPTVRDADGLALSSRNAYLDARERGHALGLVRALHAARERADPLQGERVMKAVLLEHDLAVEYAVIRHARTLQPLGALRGAGAPGRALIAARLGDVRLIDNMVWGLVADLGER